MILLYVNKVTVIAASFPSVTQSKPE